MTEVEQPPQNGIDVVTDDEELNKSRPADIEQDMREMERRKRVEAIMGSRLFREELERIVDSQIREGGASGILQQLSDIVGVPASRVGSVFKSSNCVLPINDIRGVESMGYSKGEKILRCKLAATFRLLDLYGWTQGLGAQITARLMADQELFLVNPFGLLYHEVTASSLNKADMQGNIVEQGTTNFGINTSHYILHTVVHAARPDIRCAIYVGCNPVVAVSSLKAGLLPLTKDSAVLGEIAIHPYTGALNEPEEREKLIRSLGPNSKVLLLNNHGALCCGETIEEAFYAAYHIVQACETQLKLLPVGIDNLVLIPEEARKTIYDASRRPPDGFDHLKLVDSNGSNNKDQTDNKLEQRISQQKPKWRVGGAEYEALMRMLDNAGFRTGYIYRHPLVKSDIPKPKNDIEVPPAVSSLGYLLEEEELYRQGVWKKSDLRKGGDRSRWLNSPNVYQKVEVLETGTPDPKKITKWVADASPTHSTAVRIDNALQFVPPGTNPKEFKKLQQQIKDNRRADKISAGPQSHILEGVTWDEANRIKDANVSQTGDHVVLMGAASKGIIQRGYQHNATVYKAPYAKNPFDNVTDDELNEYKRTVTKKKSVHGEYTDTDFSESEALSSTLNTSGAQQKSSLKKTILTTQSEPEDAESHVLRIETKQAPKPSQPEVVLSDADSDNHSNSISFRKRLSSFLRATNDFISNERSHTATNKKPPTGRANNKNFNKFDNKNFNINYTSPTRSINNQQLTTINNNQTTKLISNTNNNNNNNEICTKSVLTNWRELIYPTISSRNALKELSSFKTNFIREDGTNATYDLISSDEFYSVPDKFENEQNNQLYNSAAVYSCRDSSKIVQKFRNPYYDDGNVDDENLNIFLYGDKRYSSKSSKPFYLHSQSVNDLNNDNQSFNDYYKREINSEPNSPFRSPYRTVSHFGFNCPMGLFQPEHKHIPITPSKYVPLKREMSYDEVFASPRYVDSSEDIFNNVLKRKAFQALRKNTQNNVNIQNRNYANSPEKKRVKLSPPTFSSTTNEIVLYESDNDIDDDDDDDDDSLLDDSDSPVEISSTFELDVKFLNILEKQTKLHEDIGQLQNLYDTMNLAKLDPILEEVSSDIDDLASSNRFENDDDTNMLISNNNNDYSTVPTFIKKIIQMNYTEESPNLNFIAQLSSENSDLNMSLLTQNKTPSVGELDEQLEQRCLSEEEHHGSETRIEEKKLIEKNKIMSRGERCQRQEEFYELWEDHLNFYGGTEDSYNSDNEEFYSITNIPNNSQDVSRNTEFELNKDENMHWNNNEKEEVYHSQVTISRFGNVFQNQEIVIKNNNDNIPNIMPNKSENDVQNSSEIIPTLDEIMDWKNIQKENETNETILTKSENIILKNCDKQDKDFELKNRTEDKIIDLENYNEQIEVFEQIINDANENKIIDMENYDSETFEKIASDDKIIELESYDNQVKTYQKFPTDFEIIQLENYYQQNEACEQIPIHNETILLEHSNKQTQILDIKNIVVKSYKVHEETVLEISVETGNIEWENYDIERKKSAEPLIADDDEIKSFDKIVIERKGDIQEEINHEVISEDEATNLKEYFIQNQIFTQIIDSETIELENFDKQIEEIEQLPTEDVVQFKKYATQSLTLGETIELEYLDKEVEEIVKLPTEDVVQLNKYVTQSLISSETIELKNFDEQIEEIEQLPTEDVVQFKKYATQSLISSETIEIEEIEQLPTEDVVQFKKYATPSLISSETIEIEEIEQLPTEDVVQFKKYATQSLFSGETIESEYLNKQIEEIEQLPTEDVVQLKKNATPSLISSETIEIEEIEPLPTEDVVQFKKYATPSLISSETIELKNFDEQIEEIEQLPTEDVVQFKKYATQSLISSETIEIEEIEQLPTEDVVQFKKYATEGLIQDEFIVLENHDKQIEAIGQLLSEDVVQVKYNDNIELKTNNNQHGNIHKITNKDAYTYDYDTILDEFTKLKINKEINKSEENLTETITKLSNVKIYDETSEENITQVCKTFELNNEETSSSEQNIKTKYNICNYYGEEENDNLREVPTEDEITEIYNLLKRKETFKEIPTKDEILKIFSEINHLGNISENRIIKEREKSIFETEVGSNVDVQSLSETLSQKSQQINIDTPILTISENCISNFNNIVICEEIRSSSTDTEFCKLYGSRNKMDKVIPVEPDIFSSDDENFSEICLEKSNLECDQQKLRDNIEQSKLNKNRFNDSDNTWKNHLDSYDVQETETLDGIQSLNSDSDEPSTAKISDIDHNKSNIFFSPQSITNITEYKSILGSNDDTDLLKDIATGYDENSLNSIELKILQKIEENNFNKKGTIFNKIDKEIRSKITPGKIEKIVSDSESCPSKSLPYSSTPTFVITESASYESFYSLNLSEVKAANEMRKKSKLRLKHNKSITTPNTTQESFSPTSSSVSGTDVIDEKKSATKIKKGITRNVNRANNIHRAKFSRTPSPVVVTTPKSANSLNSSNSNIVSRYSPSATSYTVKRRQRNFITENIRNVSSPSSSRSSFIERYRKANVSAIFSKNPFGPRYSNEKISPIIETSSKNNNRKLRKSPRKLSPQKSNDYYNSVYPFQSKTTLKGSPKLWVSMSPPYKKQKNIFKTECKRNKSKISNQEQQIDNNNNNNNDNLNLLVDVDNLNLLVDVDNLNLLVDVACSNVNTNINSSTKVSNELDSLDEATKTLAKIVERYDENVEIFSNHVTKLNENLNDCQQIQDEIEEERQELRISMAQSRREENLTYDMLTYSISEEDD